MSSKYNSKSNLDSIFLQIIHLSLITYIDNINLCLFIQIDIHTIAAKVSDARVVNMYKKLFGLLKSHGHFFIHLHMLVFLTVTLCKLKTKIIYNHCLRDDNNDNNEEVVVKWSDGRKNISWFSMRTIECRLVRSDIRNREYDPILHWSQVISIGFLSNISKSQYL